MSIIAPPEPLTIPLRRDEAGAIRVGETRVLLEIVVQAFRNGATPEEIVQGYDTLHLADGYAVLAWCSTHEAEVEGYLRQVDEKSEAIRRTIEAAQPPRAELRERFIRPGAREGRNVMTETATSETFRQAMKEVVLEVLNENRDLFRDVVAEALEDYAMAEAIKEGAASEAVSRERIFEVLEDGQ